LTQFNQPVKISENAGLFLTIGTASPGEALKISGRSYKANRNNSTIKNQIDSLWKNQAIFKIQNCCYEKNTLPFTGLFPCC
jgi:hypothetical protein